MEKFNRNFELIIFGNPDGRYYQYPRAHEEQVKKFARNRQNTTQLLLCREQRIVYYAYLRRLNGNEDKYFGICLIFNKVYCNDISNLYAFFDQIYDTILQKGKWLINQNEQVVVEMHDLKDLKGQKAEIEDFIDKKLKELDSNFIEIKDNTFRHVESCDVFEQININIGNLAILKQWEYHPSLCISRPEDVPVHGKRNSATISNDNDNWLTILCVIAVLVTFVLIGVFVKSCI